MPPNAKGGKGYKKGKHAADSAPVFLERESDQMYGRVLRSLGNRRFRVYCNDDRERICRLCGSMRKSDWVEEGRIVILSVRQLGTATTAATAAKEDEVGDILAIIDPRTYNKVRKEEGVNSVLFVGAQEFNAEGGKKKTGVDLDDLFDRGEDQAAESSDDSPDDETPEERKIRIRLRDQARAAGRATKAVAAAATTENGDLDVDAI
jgi:initiation factor 1A